MDTSKLADRPTHECKDCGVPIVWRSYLHRWVDCTMGGTFDHCEGRECLDDEGFYVDPGHRRGGKLS